MTDKTMESVIALLEKNLKKVKGYNARKEALREQAIRMSHIMGTYSYSWYAAMIEGDYFETYGKRYGLLREFHTEGVC